MARRPVLPSLLGLAILASALDFGHVDLWTAEDAKDLVWQPILDWLLSH